MKNIEVISVFYNLFPGSNPGAAFKGNARLTGYNNNV
jgi:hypothetical protein